MKPSSKSLSSSPSSNKFIPKLKPHLKIDISNLDYQSLEHEAKILHLILYRNNNQHRSWPWWKYLELVYKRTIQLVDTIKEQKQLEKKVPLNKKHVPLNKRLKKQQSSSSYSLTKNNKNSKNKKSIAFVEMDNKEYWKKLVKRYEHFIKTKQSSFSSSSSTLSELKETNNNDNDNKKYIPPGTLVRTNRCYNHSLFLFNKLIPKACRAFYSIIILGHFITLGFALIGAISRIHSILDTILSTYETEFNNSLDDLSKTISSSSSTDNKSKIQFNLLWKEQEKLTRKLLAANKEKKGLLLNNSIGLDENLQALSNNNTDILKENGLEEINPDEDFGEKVSIEDLSLFLNNDDEPTTTTETTETTEPDNNNNNNNSTTENDDDNNNTIDNKLIPKKRTISDITTNTSIKSSSPSSPSSPKTKIIKIDSVSSSPNEKQQEKRQKKKSKNKSSKNSNNTIDDIFGNLLSDNSSSTTASLSKKSKDSSTNKKKKKKSKNSIDDIFNQF